MNNFTTSDGLGTHDVSIIPPGLFDSLSPAQSNLVLTMTGSINLIFLVCLTYSVLIWFLYCRYNKCTELEDYINLDISDVMKIIFTAGILSGITLLFFAWYYNLL
jgi:hypothetical protein